MSVEHTITHFIVNQIMRGRNQGNVELDYPLIEERVLDSMDLHRLVVFLEAQFGITVQDEDLLPDNFATVRAIAEMVTRLGGAEGSTR
jgi:acyl carrier protein